MKKTYEIRTRSNRAVAIFDSFDNAKKHLVREQVRIGIPLRMVEIVYTEQEIML